MIKIEYLDIEIPVYDITVEDNHNFFANDILIHNCIEIMEYTDPEEEAVCNLASIKLDTFVLDNGEIDWIALEKTAYKVIMNLDNVIDRNYYPTVETERSNLRHRPVGLGVQGLADVFMKIGIAFNSEKAKELNNQIFETLYWGAMNASHDLAVTKGAYTTFAGSPLSQGLFQFDLWDSKPTTDRYDWNSLREKIKVDGVRNSLLMALMPTASTAVLFSSKEGAECQSSNLEVRETLSGTFIIANNYLIRDLIKLGLWNETMRMKLMSENGSIQNIPEIPTSVKEVYQTVYEISQKDIIDMAADRGKYICQSQSMNLFLADPNFAKVTSMLFYAWKAGLKTGIYYLRAKPAVKAIQFTVDNSVLNKIEENNVTEEQMISEIACSLDNPEACVACGS